MSQKKFRKRWGLILSIFLTLTLYVFMQLAGIVFVVLVFDNNTLEGLRNAYNLEAWGISAFGLRLILLIPFITGFTAWYFLGYLMQKKTGVLFSWTRGYWWLKRRRDSMKGSLLKSLAAKAKENKPNDDLN